MPTLPAMAHMGRDAGHRSDAARLGSAAMNDEGVRSRLVGRWARPALVLHFRTALRMCGGSGVAEPALPQPDGSPGAWLQAAALAASTADWPCCAALAAKAFALAAEQDGPQQSHANARAAAALLAAEAQWRCGPSSSAEPWLARLQAGRALLEDGLRARARWLHCLLRSATAPADANADAAARGRAAEMSDSLAGCLTEAVRLGDMPLEIDVLHALAQHASLRGERRNAIALWLRATELLASRADPRRVLDVLAVRERLTLGAGDDSSHLQARVEHRAFSGLLYRSAAEAGVRTWLERCVRLATAGVPAASGQGSVAVSRVRLSGREQQLLEALSHGLSNKRIALALGTSPHTVRNQLAHLNRKLGARSRHEALVLGRELGLVGWPAA